MNRSEALVDVDGQVEGTANVLEMLELDLGSQLRRR